MNKKYDYCVLIGRFQCLHLNHVEIIKNALFNAKKVIILLGSANRPRSIKNPFTVQERSDMIMKSLADSAPAGSLIFCGINDYTYNDQRWALNVQSTVDSAIESVGGDPDNAKICITGNKEDFSSYYIDLFPQWNYLPTGKLNPDIKHIHASDLRKILFSNQILFEMCNYVPTAVYDFCSKFTSTDVFKTLKREYEYIEKYKKAWEAAPYAPTFVTVDAVVIQSGHVLLVKRRAEPGKGLYAMPGGFLDQNERIENAMVRELNEETKIKVPAAVLRGNIKKRGVYDAVERSLRGRTITHAFLIELPAGPLPRVKGADDAEKAFWLPISELKAENMFEDHYDIITDMLGV